ncbi:MAG: tRNA uridine-5-carboxymethylaminomethyl(34) synthesis GTPase MnmE [Pseudomonadota bacterium]
MMYSHDDTIAAIATPAGAGGIGIVKISGPLSEEIVGKLFRTRRETLQLESHYLYYGHIIDPSTKGIVDEVLLSFMHKPDTYTREDIAEINCHGGYFVLQKILSLVLSCGARLAGPGEFTKRAFLNGRLDLTQAEAVIDVISARSSQSLNIAAGQVSGSLRDSMMALHDSLVDVLSFVEAAIDFPEEDIEILSGEHLVQRLEDTVIKPAEELIKSHEDGRVYREGASVAITGNPNVGKSSILNRLLDAERAIVTDIPGTTRDVIEETLNIHGISVRIVDTAGIREARDRIEEIGIKLTRESIERADLLLFVIDGSAPLRDEDRSIYHEIRHKPVIAVLNKMDLGLKVSPEQITGSFSAKEAVAVSALEGTNIENLRKAIFSALVGDIGDVDGKIVPNARHYAVLSRLLAMIRQAVENLAREASPEVVAIDIREALECLDEITGRTTPDDILDRIFSRFCIGK